jgi:transaldolase
MNPLLALNQPGQFVWLDHISRSLITGGRLRRLIDDERVGGVTSNPTMFDKAIAGSTDYDGEGTDQRRPSAASLVDAARG